MRTLGSAVAAVAVVAAAGIGVAACGSNNDSGGSSSTSSSGKTGGSIEIGSVLPDSYDPVLVQTVQGNMPAQLQYTGLVTYKHETGPAGNQLIPGLAEAMPTVSADGKTYTFKLRSGLKYSDGSPVVASDFEHTIKRLLYLGGPFSSFSTVIEGAAAYQEAKKSGGDISGITSDDKTGEITVKLTEPDSKFLFAMALISAAPTPAAKSPFKATSDGSIPGAGPYKISVQNPTRQFTLTKNAGFDVPTIPKPKLDKITVVKETVPKMTQDVIANKLDFMTEDPAGDDLPLV
jgi:peptide/nickel transport system substrate-binding protein